MEKRMAEGEIVFEFVRNEVTLDSLQSAKVMMEGRRDLVALTGSYGTRLARSPILITD